MAKEGFELTGIQEVMDNLNREIENIEGAGKRGLISAAVIIRRDMDKTPPKIPIDTGNLRASWTTVRLWPAELALLMGFNANYAVFVHESVGADFTSPRKRYTQSASPRGPRGGRYIDYTPRPGAGAKFFEASLYRNKELVLQTIRDNIVKGTTKKGY
jgi:hypothetical protein